MEMLMTKNMLKNLFNDLLYKEYGVNETNVSKAHTI